MSREISRHKRVKVDESDDMYIYVKKLLFFYTMLWTSDNAIGKAFE